MTAKQDDEPVNDATHSTVSETTTLDETVFGDDFLERILESTVRVTLAGLGGTLVGRGLQEIQQKRAWEQRDSNLHQRKVPPALVGRPRLGTNLPGTWALSCALFVLIVETSRRASPMTMMLQAISQDEEKPKLSKYQRIAFVSSGDFAFGGTVAGLAATVAKKTPIRFGVGVGMGLGLAAGVFQAAVDVGELYLLEERETRQ
jgi:hypothetical protein